MEMKFTTANFEEEVLKSEIPVLVDFYADWCGPCQMMAPVIGQLAGEYGYVDPDDDYFPEWGSVQQGSRR